MTTLSTLLFKGTNLTLQDLVGIAYDVQPYRIVELPTWGKTVGFDIHASSSDDVTQDLIALGDAEASTQKRHMLQALLRDRFGLIVHKGQKERGVLFLEIAKGGVKLLQQGTLQTSPGEAQRFAGKPPSLYQSQADSSGYVFIAHGCSMSELVMTLEAILQHPVEDRTNLREKYDFKLEYKDARLTPDSRGDSQKPILQQALTQQLGLQLRTGKYIIETLVIARVTPPTPN